MTKSLSKIPAEAEACLDAVLHQQDRKCQIAILTVALLGARSDGFDEASEMKQPVIDVLWNEMWKARDALNGASGKAPAPGPSSQRMSLKNIPDGYVAVSVDAAASFWSVSRSTARNRLVGHHCETELVPKNGKACSARNVYIIPLTYYQEFAKQAR